MTERDPKSHAEWLAAEVERLRAAIKAHRAAWANCNATDQANVRPADWSLWKALDG